MTSIKPLPQTPTTAPVLAAVQAASARTGIDFDYLVDVARVESRFDPTAKAPTSSARGLYQFTTQTWLETIDTRKRLVTGPRVSVRVDPGGSRILKKKQ